MGLNFLGLGFSLGAEDKGLASALKTTSSGLMDISKSVVGIGLASAKMIFKPPNLGPTKDLITTLAGDVKTTTTALEAYGVMASKSTSAGLAGLNMTEKEFKKAQGLISSVAFSMNTDVGAVTKSFTALKQAGVDVNSQGFKKMFGSFKDYQKFIEVSGTNTESFAASLGVMEKQMGMTADQIDESVKSTAAIGKKFNIGREAIAAMSDTVKTLNEQSNRLPANWGPDRMQKFLKGTAIVQGAFTSIGLTADEAIGATKGITQQLLKGETGMRDLYAGLSKNIENGTAVVQKHLGEFPDAFKMMQESPDQFILKMGDLVEAVKATGATEETLNLFRGEMEGAFGTDIMTAFNKGFKTLAPAIKGAQGPVEGQADAIKDLSKRYKSGRTHAEEFAIAQDRVQTSLKQIKEVMSDDEYLRQYNKQSQKFLGTMNKLAADKGPIGKATTLMIDFKNRGVGGALAAHSQWGFALSEGMKVMEPFLAYLPAIGAAFLALMSPIGLAAAAVGLLYFGFKDLAKGGNSVIRPMLDKLVTQIPEFLTKIQEFAGMVFHTVWKTLSEVNWAAVAATVTSALVKVFNAIFTVVESINWKKVGKVLGIVLQKAADVALMLLGAAFRIGEKILIWLGEIDWNAVGKKFGYYLMEVASIALDAIVKVLSNLPEITMKIWCSVADFITGALDGIWDKIRAIGSKIGGFFSEIGSSIKNLVTGGSEAHNKSLNETYEKSLKATADIMALARKRHDDLVKLEHASGRATTGYVKTVEGEIIKAVDSFTRYETDAMGVIRKVARATAQYTKVAVKGEAWEAMDEYSEKASAISAKYSKLYKDVGTASEKTFEETGKLMEEFTDKYGVSYVSMLDMQEKLQYAFSDQNEVMEDAKKQGIGYYTALNSLQASLTKNLAEVGLQMVQVKEKQGEQSDEYKKLQQQYEKLNASGNATVGQYSLLMSGHVSDFLKTSTFGIEASMKALELVGGKGTDAYIKLSDQLATTNKQNAELTAHVLSDAFKAQTGDMLKNIPRAAGEMADEIKKKYGDRVLEVMNQIGDMQKKEQQALIEEGKLDETELDKQLKAIRDIYQNKAEEIRKITVDNSKLISMGTADGANKALDKLTEGLDKMKKQVDAKTSEAAGEIQNLLGVSGSEAVQTVKDFYAIKPTEFKRNIGIVQKAFVDFLKEMDTKAKDLMNNTIKSFNALWESLDKGWKDSKKLLEEFGTSADKLMTTFWKMIVDKSTTAATQIVGISKSIETSMRTMARAINLMDLLTSPDQITAWAASVVSALATAFRGGSVADSLLSSSYTKALAMAGEIQRATPDSANMTNPAQTSGASSATATLLASINHPAWTDKKEYIPAKLEEINQNLLVALKAMGEVAQGKAVSKPRPPKIDR